MDNKKLIGITLVALAIVSVIIVALPYAVSALSGDNERTDNHELKARNGWVFKRSLREMSLKRSRWMKRKIFEALKNGEYRIVRVEGVLSDWSGRMIILTNNGRSQAVILPGVKWVANGEVYSWIELIWENIVNKGDNVIASIIVVDFGNHSVLILGGLNDTSTGYLIKPALPVISG